jgi:hypothetical protein
MENFDHLTASFSQNDLEDHEGIADLHKLRYVLCISGYLLTQSVKPPLNY